MKPELKTTYILLVRHIRDDIDIEIMQSESLQDVFHAMRGEMEDDPFLDYIFSIMRRFV